MATSILRTTAKSPVSIFRLLFLFALFSQITFSQYRFDSWTTDNGLPQNGVRQMAQTPDGYLWFTTFDGLVRFDGVKFSVFDKNNSPGISSNRFFLLNFDKEGRLFAGVENGGLTVYEKGIFRTYTTADGLASNALLAITREPNGEVQLRSDAGADYFREGKFVPAGAEFLNNGRYYHGPTGTLWTYGADGVRRFNAGNTATFFPINFRFYNERFSGVRPLEDRAGNFWISDLDGIYRINGGEVKRFGPEAGIPAGLIVRPFVEDNEGGVWFASGLPWVSGAGVIRYHDGKFAAFDKTNGLSSDSVQEIFRDREGTIWVSTTDRGINRLQKQFAASLSTEKGLSTPEVYPLLRAKSGDVYVGSTKGVNLYRDGKFTKLPIKNINGDDLLVTALYEDAAGRLWIGSLGDLYIYDGKRARVVPGIVRATVWMITNDRAGNVWVASEKGLYKIAGDRLTAKYTTADGLPGDDVKFIHQRENGELWFGTYGGLARLKPDGTFKAYTTAEGLASDRVRTIFEDKNGVLWIGTYDGGLSKFQNGGFFNFTVENGLFNNGVFQIFEDNKDNFWISCNRGVFRVNRRELEDVAAGRAAKINSVSYGKRDGMLNTECNGGRQPAGIAMPDGKLWFPTQDGVAVFDPASVTLNPNPPPVQIEDVLIERSAVPFAGGVLLNANDDNLAIRYTGISFIKPEQVKFRYRIEGLNDDWTDVGTIRELYFPSLPAGEYTFHVIAANSDGVWNEEGARVRITVKAPFWQNTWFIVFSALIAVAAVFIGFKARERELQRRQRVQQQFSRSLLESQERERKRIASEMHDSLGQYLLAIKNWAMFGLNSLGEKDPARQYLAEVSDTSALAIDEVREIAHNLRPYQLERLGLTRTLKHMAGQAGKSAAINITAGIDDIDGVLPSGEEIIFYRIAQECLNNIIKHSAAKNARLTVRLMKDGLIFTAGDDGRGFDVESAKRSPDSGLGLSGLNERVRILGGEYNIESAPGAGTTVSVKIPKINPKTK